MRISKGDTVQLKVVPFMKMLCIINKIDIIMEDTTENTVLEVTLMTTIEDIMDIITEDTEKHLNNFNKQKFKYHFNSPSNFMINFNNFFY